MSTRALTGAALLALLLATGCGSGEPPPEPGADAPAPTSDDSGAFEPLTDTVERAEGVQSTVDERADELRRRTEEAEN